MPAQPAKNHAHPMALWTWLICTYDLGLICVCRWTRCRRIVRTYICKKWSYAKYVCRGLRLWISDPIEALGRCLILKGRGHGPGPISCTKSTSVRDNNRLYLFCDDDNLGNLLSISRLSSSWLSTLDKFKKVALVLQSRFFHTIFFLFLFLF